MNRRSARCSMPAAALLLAGLALPGPAAADPVAIPGTGIEMDVPEDFEIAAGWAGLVSEESGSSVLFNELPAPFPNSAPHFLATLAPHGIEVMSRDTVEVDGHEALLVSARQSARGVAYRKWMLVFGDEERTRIATATFPQAQQKILSDRLRAALLSIRSAAKAKPLRLAFTVRAPRSLKPVSGASGMQMLMLTKNGLWPATATEDPVFAAWRSVSHNVPIANRRAFALQRARKVDVLEDLVIETVEDVVIDGLPGIEIVGVGHNRSLGVPVLLHQVVLFPETDYFLTQAMVADAQRKKYLPLFREISRSFKRTAAP